MNGCTAVKYALLKKRNRRITLIVWRDSKDDHFITIETKRLVDFKTRQIIDWNGVIGMETFLALSATFEMLERDPEFMKATNRERGQAQKERFKCSSNIK